MALPLAIPIASAAISGAQAIGGMFSRKKARKEFEEAEMPDFFESQAFGQAQQNAGLAGRYAKQGLPEESFRFQEDMIGRSGAAALASQGSLRSGIAGSTAVAQSLSDQYRNLAGMDAQARIQQQGQYLQSLGLLQQAQQQGFDYQMGDYVNQQAARLGRMSAGNQTMNAGLEGIGTAASMVVDSGLLNMTGKSDPPKPKIMKPKAAKPIGSPIRPQLMLPR